MAGTFLSQGAQVELISSTQAVQELAEDYGRLIFHLIRSLVGDWELSQDLAQDTFVQALQGFDAARAASGARFQAKAWLVSIAINLVRMHLRRQRLMSFLPFSALEQEPEQEGEMQHQHLHAAPVQPAGYGGIEPENPAEVVAERDAVARTLARLPETLRVPLLLSVVGGLSSEEIAGILGVGEAAIRQRLSRARRQFKERYAAACGEVVRDSVATTEQQRVSAAPGVNPRLGAPLRITA